MPPTLINAVALTELLTAVLVFFASLWGLRKMVPIINKS